ncbi:S41 family peptidase [Salinimicrobium sp. TH3]|uniref:S41 family peptidase n=1 Tax=Salinimicrobium sp. TH3 TaxID=2997342 RepID=UPI00227451D2|nr:S41 family peptidase [Salinimicrobium sp. TH3]MCY2688176.1 S41 family peptidase [Salinimicrobium sp. TH3]
MKKLFLPVFLLGIFFTSCSKDDVQEEVEEVEEIEKIDPEEIEVESFIYSGMNEIYLYKADVPELADDFFSSTLDKDKFLASYDSPEVLYEDLQPEFDDFSFMHHDYEELIKMFSGISKSNGIDFGLTYIEEGSNALWGYVRYVLPGTSAEDQGVKRGDIFTSINGIKLNDENYQKLLTGDTYSIDINRIEEGKFVSSGKTITLVSSEYKENPIFRYDILEVEGKKIGYLLYNGFTGTDEFDSQLNSVFAEFKNASVSDLVLDLRYNGGGSVETAVDLASMITGQYKNEIFIKEFWNEKYQNAWSSENYLTRFDSQIRTGETTNSLGLNKVHIIATRSSASASELIINGLEPYIDVVHIGKTTRGKFQASTTLYDAPNFYRTDSEGNVHVNPNHKYVIQPLIFKSANKDGKTDFVDGLFPDIDIRENLSNYGTLGDISEPLLQAALNSILGIAQETASANQKRMNRPELKMLGESDMFLPNYQRMYENNLPILK